ncbi:hypothetical protein FRC07_004401 [Ceratobasidium sp. 392]|nr:hypothetical protein FRC07_004401 [Ceratobasidium sp. 392]
MAISASPSASPRVSNPSSTRPLPAKLRRQSTFERSSQPPPTVPQPLTPTLLSRSNTRSHSTPPQHTLAPSTASFGESIFQSLSFGPFSSAKHSDSGHRVPPTRSSTVLSNVLESPIQLEPPSDLTMDASRPPSSTHTVTSRRRVTSPDTAHPMTSTRTASPNAADAHPPSTTRLGNGNSSPRSPPLAFGDAHPRKARSTLRLSRLRPGSIRDDAKASSADPVPGTAPATMTDSARPPPIRAAVRRPGSAGSIASKPSIRSGPKDEKVAWTDDERQSAAAGSRTRGMRVRASSEFTRPVLSIASGLREIDELPPSPRLIDGRPQYAELRPALLGSSSSRLSPVPVSPGVQSTWSKKSGESALADDSDVDADVPTTPSLTRTDRMGSTSRSNSSPKQDDPAAAATPTAPFSVMDSDVGARTQAREEADRRRREEAQREREERARHAEYFVLKGPGKERCHAYPADQAPYPLSYAPRVLNHHVLDTELSRHMISSVTYHAFKEPPTKVLDLGCGTGHWIIRAAHEWPETQFVGFDLVPIQPSLERVTGRTGGAIGGRKHSDLGLNERIRWVHGNFLERLPFDDGEFDFVRCRKIARGVPESKWDALYEEMLRVMKPGAAFEQLEEDLIFPTEIPARPAHSSFAGYPNPSPNRALPTPPYLSSSSLPAGTRSSVIRPPDQYRRSPSTSFSSVLESPVEGRNGIPSAASTTSSTSFIPGSTISTSFQLGSVIGTASTLVVPGSSTPFPDTSSGAPNKDSRGSGDSVERVSKLTPIRDYSFYDPRVHTRLQEVFASMHHARWINLKPLSLIPRLIQEHFVGVISSPPLNMNIPPRPREGALQSRVADVAAITRASGDGIVAKARLEQDQSKVDSHLLEPQPGDDEVRQYLAFDFLRMGSVSRSQGLPRMPVARFQLDLAELPMHLSCAASDIIACKEAMWEHLKEQEPEFERRDYDTMIKQYQTDMQDRIGLSTTLRQKLGWGPPESDFTRTADQRVFEENYAQAIALDQVDPASARRPPGLMRCVRAFVAWKAAE